jgi:hypothetical protein
LAASRKRSSPCFGPGSSEARCERCSRAAQSLVIAYRDRLRLRPTPDTVQGRTWQRTVLSEGFGLRLTQRWHHPPRAFRLRCRLGLAPPDNGDSVLIPSGVRSRTGCVACRSEWTGGFAPQIHHSLTTERDFATSRCGNTLKWRPRTWKAERSICLHLVHSVPRSKNLKADFC